MKNIKLNILVFAAIVCTTRMAYSQSTPSISVSSVTSSSITVSWSSASYTDPAYQQTYNASVYMVQVSTDNSFPSSTPTYTYSSSTRSAIISVSPSTAYSVRVGAVFPVAVNGDYNPQYSQPWLVNTPAYVPPPPPIPDAPILTAATNITSTAFTANWAAVSGADSYTIDVSSVSDFSSGTNFQSMPPARIASYVVPGTLFYFRVRATNQTGSSNYSNVMTVWTLPDAPNALAATQITSTSFTASWVSVTGATGYRLEVSASKDFSNAMIFSPSGTSFSVTGLTPRTSYYYRVQAIDPSGLSGYSNIIYAVDLDHNYVRSVALTVPGKKTLDDVESATVQERLTKFDYVDGVGRPSQSVSVQASPSHTDVVQPFFYDAYGRESVKYLPYTAESNGFFKESALAKSATTLSTPDDQYHASQQYNFYQTGGEMAADSKPYSQIIFEPTMLNRVVSQGGPGAIWQPDPSSTYLVPTDHAVKSSYEANGLSEVLFFHYNTTTGLVDVGTPQALNYYDANVLHAKKTKDEHNNEVIEYTDKDGHVVCKKVQYGVDASLNKLYAETYYVYDDSGDLMVVLPPEAVKALISSSSN